MSETATFETVLEDIYDDIGETITYNGTDILAGISYEEDLEQKKEAAKANCIIMVKSTDVTRPGYRDTIVIGSITWKLLNIISGDQHSWKLKLYRDERPIL